MGTVISVANNKGGVGKTTTAINLAYELKKSGHSTLLIDLDPQYNATQATLDEVPGASYVDNLEYDTPLRELITHAPYYDILPSHLALDSIVAEYTSDDHDIILSLQMALSELSGYDYIIIDTTPSLGLLLRMALIASSHVLIPVQAANFSLAGLANLRDYIGSLSARYDTDTQIMGAFIALYDSRQSIDRAVANQLRAQYNDVMLNTIIAKNTAISQALAYRMPVGAYDEQSRGARDYMQLAREVMAHAKEDQNKSV